MPSMGELLPENAPAGVSGRMRRGLSGGYQSSFAMIVPSTDIGDELTQPPASVRIAPVPSALGAALRAALWRSRPQRAGAQEERVCGRPRAIRGRPPTRARYIACGITYAPHVPAVIADNLLILLVGAQGLEPWTR
jgi:hypothetical protein